MASLSSLIVNIAKIVYSQKGKIVEITKPADFMPDWDGSDKKETKKQNVEDMKRVLQSVFKQKPEKNRKVRTTPPRRKK